MWYFDVLLILLTSAPPFDVYIHSAVGIATRYELDGWGDRIPLVARFSAPIHTGPGAYPATCTLGTGSFQGVKRPGRGVVHSPPSSAEVKERVELYLYSPWNRRTLCVAPKDGAILC